MTKNHSDVISFRTRCLNELKQLSGFDNASISATVEKIITKYIQYYQKMEMRNHMCCPRDEIVLLYDCVDVRKSSSDILKFKVSQYVKEIKFIYGKPTFKNIYDDICYWLVNNGCEIKEHYIENEIKLNVIHNMGRTWCKINSHMIDAIFKKFDYNGFVDQLDDESFTYTIIYTNKE